MKKAFCENCNKLVGYNIVEKNTYQTIREKKYYYNKIYAFCNDCGEELSDSDITDENLRRLDKAFRLEEHIITVDEISEILRKYKIGKKPLAKLLGWGEVTLIRYLNGDSVPTRPYSDELYKILNDSNYMLEVLEGNKDRITTSAYNKVKNEINAMNKLNIKNGTDSQVDLVAAYIASKIEVTPLALQKLLYYAQGFYIAFFGKSLIKEDCQAWVHGPVYPNIYNKFRSYGREIIQVNVDYDIEDILDDSRRELLNAIINYFGYYNGTALEKMSHIETPWIAARAGLQPDENSNKVISKKSMKDYFNLIKEKYNMINLADIRAYSNYLFDEIIKVNS